jgi:serine/threonine protein kinase/tetratricopeptide (TPR) repeat protein
MERDPTLPAESGAFAAAADLTGRVLAGRYALQSRIGAGGMGAVYLGRDLRLEREVAVKVILGVTSTGETPVESSLLARFIREARAVATLGHPAIVTVFDAGFDPAANGDVPYIVMERLRGESLADRLARGPMDSDSATRVVNRVLEGLAAAHAAGLVHRDIKPANVFLCAPDSASYDHSAGESAKILDFGVAGVSADGRAQISGSDQRLTTAGLGVGTPMYMAPEQLRGDPPDLRADLYAVGALLFECLAGRPLYQARTVAELCAKKLTEEPPSLRAIGPRGVSDALCAVVDRALRRDPDARFADANAMRRALSDANANANANANSALRGPVTNPVAGVTPSAFELPPSAPEKRGSKLWPVAAGVLLGVAVFVGGRAYVGGSQRARVSMARSVNRAATSLTGRLVRDAGVPLIQPTVGLRTFTQFHDASGSARSGFAAPDLWELAADDFRRAIEAAARQNIETPTRWTAAQRAATGKARVLRGSIDEGVSDLRVAVQLEPEWAVAHVLLADALSHRHDVESAVSAVHRAEQLEPQWWFPPMVLGMIYSHGERWDEAIQAMRRALERAPEEPALLDVFALTMHGNGMDSQADAYAARALAKDPDVLWSHVLRAERAIERRDGRVALEESERAVSISPRAAAGHLARGEALLLLRRPADAREALARGLSLVREGRQLGIARQRVARLEATIASSVVAARGANTERSRAPRTQVPAQLRTRPSPVGSERSRSADHSQGNMGL